MKQSPPASLVPTVFGAANGSTARTPPSAEPYERLKGTAYLEVDMDEALDGLMAPAIAVVG